MGGSTRFDDSALDTVQRCFQVYRTSPWRRITDTRLCLFLESANQRPRQFVFTDSTSNRRGRNIVGHRAILDDSGQSGGNIAVCAATANVLHRRVTPGPDNTDHIVTFLDSRDNMLIPAAHMDNTQEPIMLSSGTMSASIMQHWSKTGLLSTHNV